MYPSPAWQQPTTLGARPHNGRIDLRDRISAYPVVEDDSNQRGSLETELRSPTDDFFARSSLFLNQGNTRQTPATRAQKRRQAQQELGKPQKLQQHRPSLHDLQATESPLAKELIEHIVDGGNTLYSDALSNITELNKALIQVLADTAAEDDRFLTLLDTNDKKTAKPLSETRVSNRVGEEIHIGERVASFKAHIDTLEAEVASLWDQLGAAQKEVDDISAELTTEQRGEHGDQAGSVTAVKESLAREMGELEEELDGILEAAHEALRVSEKDFSNKIKGVMSALLQQYLLE